MVRHCHDLSSGDAAFVRRSDMPDAHGMTREAGNEFGSALLAHAFPLSPQLDASLDDVAERPVGQPADADMLRDAPSHDWAKHGRARHDASDCDPLLDFGT